MPLNRGFRYWALLMSTSFWLLLVAWPVLSPKLGWGPAGWVYLVFKPVCHQLSSRSFHPFGHQLAVCTRCTGIYLGFWLGLLILPGWRRLSGRLLAQPRILLLFALPMFVNVLLPDNTPWGRFATGLLAGFPVSLFVWIALEQIRAPLRARETA